VRTRPQQPEQGTQVKSMKSYGF